MKNLGLCLWTCFLTGIPKSIWAQPTPKGLKWDHALYNQLPRKALLKRGLYDNLPSSGSLKAYCPKPGDQRPYQTCVGWASGYAARTILWARQNHQTNTAVLRKQAYSPAFVYKSVEPNDQNCAEGTELPHALKLLDSLGVVLKNDYEEDCPAALPNQVLRSKAAAHKIECFVPLFEVDATPHVKIKMVQKALAEGNPVVIGMHTPPSFETFSITDALWTPTETPDMKKQDGHALCIIGYDDHKFGKQEGAFEFMNSWGTDWRKGGFVWVRYKDFAQWTEYAFELIPKMQRIAYSPTDSAHFYDLSGQLQFNVVSENESPSGIEMKTKIKYANNESIVPTSPHPNQDLQLTAGQWMIYRMKTAYPEGTQFQLWLRNNEPAYVYAIATDTTNRMSLLFPHQNISPALTYAQNELVLPAEDRCFKLKTTEGLDVFCLLYSKIALDIDMICKQIETEKGTFFQRLHKVLGNQLVDPKDLRYYHNSVRFEANTHKGMVVPIVVEIPHHE